MEARMSRDKSNPGSLLYKGNASIKAARREARRAVAPKLIKLNADFITAAIESGYDAAKLQNNIFNHCKRLDTIIEELEHGQN
jgi:hypothetical protein